MPAGLTAPFLCQKPGRSSSSPLSERTARMVTGREGSTRAQGQSSCKDARNCSNRTATARASFSLPSDTTMKLGVLTSTHDAERTSGETASTRKPTRTVALRRRLPSQRRICSDQDPKAKMSGQTHRAPRKDSRSQAPNAVLVLGRHAIAPWPLTQGLEALRPSPSQRASDGYHPPPLQHHQRGRSAGRMEKVDGEGVLRRRR